MAKDILKYPGWMYAYGIASGQLSMKDARVEYQRIYHALRERQRRLQQSEFSDTPFAKKQLTPLSKVKSERQLVEQLQSMSAMARGRMTSISGLREYRKDVADALDQYGEGGKSFSDMTRANWNEFGAYMRRIHKAHFDSERAVAIFRLAKDAGMTGASLYNDYTYWRDHAEDLERYTASGRALGGRASSSRIRDYIATH